MTMAGQTVSADPAAAIVAANLDAFFRHRTDVPAPCDAGLTTSLGWLRGSDDPVVTFGSLPGVCVPVFADGCQVELCDEEQPSFRVVFPVSSADASGSAPAPPVAPEDVLATPFRVVPRVGYPSYAGVVTHWWTGRKPDARDAVIADLTVKHVVALIDQERLMAAVARAEDRAADLAMLAITGRTISIATGIVMHQNRLAADDAEDLLRHSGRTTGTGLHQVAAGVVRSGSLGVRRA
jgi:hypothetical protein